MKLSEKLKAQVRETTTTEEYDLTMVMLDNNSSLRDTVAFNSSLIEAILDHLDEQYDQNPREN